MRIRSSVLAGVVGAGLTVSAGAAALTNGGFEAGSTGWHLLGDGAAVVTNSSAAHGGAALLQIQPVAGQNSSAYQHIGFSGQAVGATLTYYYSILSTDAVANATFSVNLSYSVSNGIVVTNILLKSNLDTNAPAGAYARGTWDLTPFLSSSDLQVQFLVSGATSGGSVFNVDDVSVTELAPNPPVVLFSSPGAWTTELSSANTVAGTAVSNSLPLAAVWYKLNQSGWSNATGTTNWSAPVTLAPGINTFYAYAVDAAGTASATNCYSFCYSPSVVLFLQTNGPGTITVSPNYNGKALLLNRTYSLAAAPKRGSDYIFSNWVGSIFSSSAKLTIKGQSNLVLQANFVPNPFLKGVGAYSGMFYETNQTADTNAAQPNVIVESPRVPHAGSFTAKISSQGAFSASVRQGGAKYSFSGQLGLTGAWSTNSIKGAPGMAASLQLDVSRGILTGRLNSNTLWSATLTACLNPYNARTNKAPGAGKYTVVIPAGTNAATQPGGNSVATLNLSTAGAVSLSGKLADGTPFSESTTLAAGGDWPLYVSLYANHGNVFGWLSFTNDSAATNAIQGWVAWNKPLAAGLYANGFAYYTEDIIGSSWTNAGPYLTWTNGVIELQDGNLSQGLTNQINLNAHGKLTDVTATNKLKLSLTTSSGLWSGSIVNPTTHKAVKLTGVVLRNRDLGYGFFTGTNQSGSIYLGRP